MTGKERIFNTIEGKPVDRPAVWPFVMAFSAQYCGVPYSEFATNAKRLAEAQVKTAIDFELDAVVADTDPFREASACGAVLSFPEDDLPKLEKQAILDKATFSFQQPNIDDCERLMDKINAIAHCKALIGEEKAVVGWIEAPYQSAGTFYPMNEFLADIYMNPAFIKKLLDFTTELGIEFAVRQVHAGADILGVGDAMASLVSPKVYKELILPSTKRLVQGIRERCDVKLKYHMCGDATHLLENIKEIGFDIVSVDYKVDMNKAASVLGDVCLKGNMNPTAVLMEGTLEEVQQEANRLLHLGLPRFILGAGCEVPKSTPPENLKMLAQCAKAFSS